MISLISEMTDAKGRQASRGWIFFDRECDICTSLARRFRPTFERRGFGLAALQDPRAAPLLGLPLDQLLSEMRVVTGSGESYGGAEAIVYLVRQIWWAWPIFAAAQIPGVPRILGAGYRRFADHRQCISGNCLGSRGSHVSSTTKQLRGEPK
jgi:predicted DCC family thiol-disulfide oxidoreductase YuxK